MSPRAAQDGQSTEETPDRLLLKDYRPESIYRTPKTEVKKARYPIIDAHCHGAGSAEQVKDMVKMMDTVGVEKTVIFTGATRPEQFAGISRPYSQYPERFDLWCGFDLTNCDQPGFGPDAVRALEECHRLGARGVGEISDKGKGFGGHTATGPHADDPRMDPLFDKCASLGIPINIHVSDPIWAYEPMDKTNDGLPNGYKWRIAVKPGILGHNELIETLERAVQKHPKTIFIACHLANLGYDLTRLGHMFDRHSNLYADISARFG